ncbi:MAG: metallophosphoesterase [Clostridia bacterium]|nr:metallophosphoesterase [Clostridia bacterium]
MRRSIAFHVAPDGSVSPAIPQYGGVKGEHNVTTLSMTLSASAPYREGDLVRLRFAGGDGSVLSSDLITDYIVQDGRMVLSYALPAVLTRVGGQLGVRLVLSAVDENGTETETFLSSEAVLWFDEAPTENGTPFWTGVSEMLKRTTAASDAAAAARDAARNEKEAAASDADRAERASEAANESALAAATAKENATLYASAAMSARDQAEASKQAAADSAAKANNDAQKITESAQDIEQNKENIQTLMQVAYSLQSQKLQKDGHAPNRLLGTDAAGNVVTKEETPSYVVEEAKATAAKVLSHQSEDSFTLAWLSDLHVGNAYQVGGKWSQDETSNTEAGLGLHEMSKTAPCDVIAVGGDLASGTIMTAHDDGLAQLDECIGCLRPVTAYTPTLYLMGNHDDAPFRATADRLTRAELFSRLGRQNLLAGAVNGKGCLYGYKDFEAQKMRVIYLDTHDKNGWESAECVAGETANSAYMDACNLSAKQLRWFANVALDFSGKESPSEWGVIVLSHTPLTIHSGTGTYTANGKSYDYNTDNAVTILDAYLRKGSGTITHGGETVSYDFSALTEQAQLYCHIHGHIHAFRYAAIGAKGIPSIGCPNTRDGSERKSDDGNTYVKTAGTGKSCSFNVITIDRKNGKIYADNHGAGIDREWDAVVYSAHTNLVPTSLDTDYATVYNGVGYANDTRISGINTSAGAGYVATGIMPYARKADGTFPTLYVKGAAVDTAKSYVRMTCMQEVDGNLTSSASAVGAGSGQTAWDYWFTIETLGTLYYRLTPTDNLTAKANTRYIRMSLYGAGDDLIITADEPIE